MGGRLLAELRLITVWRECRLRAMPPVKLSTRTLGHAIEEALMGGYTRVDLETVLADELGLEWLQEDSPAD